MNYKDKETLSQLMDGEWQDLDPSHSVKATCANTELKDTWSRYHLVRDVIRNESIAVDTSLSARISSAIADEPTYSNVSAIGTAPRAINSEPAAAELSENSAQVKSNQATPSHWRLGLGGVALAASVALATVLGLNVWQGGAPAGAVNSSAVGSQSIASVPGTAANVSSANVPGAVLPVVLPEVEYVANKGTYWVSPAAKRNPVSEKRLNMLLTAHIESSPTAERSGMLPYSRLVGYDSVAAEQ